MTQMGARAERWAAFAVCAASCVAFLWLRWQAGHVSTTLTVRDEQVRHLEALLAPAALPVGRRPAPAVVASLDGLVEGHRVVWRDSDFGRVLTLSPVAAGSGR